DMPCMDDAQLRRGKPTIHVQYGEDVAILASIALLSRAFGILGSAQDIPPAVRARLVARLSETIGAQGLVRGQFLDLQATARSAEDIATTNELKTGVLLG
ncbi:MAG TPA: geranylgeranyl pyrophosphate synthase, partial [Massilia sp.]|nr:geranylgeranyl pyrophosphate synthase [Massilia sp.]